MTEPTWRAAAAEAGEDDDEGDEDRGAEVVAWLMVGRFQPLTIWFKVISRVFRIDARRAPHASVLRGPFWPAPPGAVSVSKMGPTCCRPRWCITNSTRK